jgi:hypothetical protein
VAGSTLYELGDALAAHPAFAPAWTQKLCRFANSELCANDDPEFQRISAVFAQSGFQFPTLVRELFSSPLVTHQARTASAEKFGVIISIARQSALCQSLEVRTKVPDLCGLQGKSELSTQRLRDQAANLALAVPGDAYARGEEKPLMPRDANLFFFSAVENMCALLASEVVESKTRPLYRVSEKDAALRDFVTTMMGVPAGDSRFGEVLQLLADHHAAALDAGVSPVDALRATFVLACESPLTISLGL